MAENLSIAIIEYLDKFNRDFEKKYGYRFCRCYACVMPILFKCYTKMKLEKLSVDILVEAINNINDDYLYSADFKLGVRSKSGLCCGYDCVHYEEMREACPLTFWEIEKIHLQLLVDLLDALNYFQKEGEFLELKI